MEEVEVYDVEEAARVVSERTGMASDVVEEILEAEFLFQAALGVVEVVEDDEEGAEFVEEIRQLRQTHADLVPPIDADLDALEDLDDRLVTFVSRLTGAEPATIEDVLDEHLLYLEEQGLLEPAEDED
jgi:cell division FtsZ-interacting protein ZapD